MHRETLSNVTWSMRFDLRMRDQDASRAVQYQAVLEMCRMSDAAGCRSVVLPEASRI